MIAFLKRARERKAKASAEDLTRRSQLFTKLVKTLGAVETWLIDIHSMTIEEIKDLASIAADMQEGMRLVLLDGIEGFDAAVPDPCHGGAILANSAHAYFELSAALKKPELETMVGSTEDKETTGHMCYQLGFSRDGLQKRS